MCGIAGFIDFKRNTSSEDGLKIVNLMCEALVHRGPDSSGYWHDGNAGIFLGHRRLAIVDLTISGHQPMISNSNRYVMTFNGEIYNHNDLRNELLNNGITPVWRGHSDTEVALAYIEAYGLERALTSFVGMFAIALFDRQQNKLFLVRDRVGEKPLYWSKSDGHIFFGSELTALRKHPYFSANISVESVSQLIDFNFISSPYSIYEEVFKVKPGHVNIINMNNGSIEEKSYWNPLINHTQKNIIINSTENAVDELNRLIRQAVAIQLQADVPVGAFLSGGIDSSTIAAVAQSLSKSKINTFSIGFEDSDFDEAIAARSIAKNLGTNHTELYISAKDAQNVIPNLVNIYDEPFADSSQIPTYLVAELARKTVTVSLSGDGGDELFLGYNRYLIPENLLKILFNTPKIFDYNVLQMKKYSTGYVGDKSDGNMGLLLKIINNYSRIKSILCEEKENRYRNLISHKPSGLLLINKKIENRISLHSPFPSQLGKSNKLSTIENMALIDFLTYLPDDVLTKVDRAAMAVSLETRIPLLDHRIIEFAFSLPLQLKIKNNQSKWILRQVLFKYLKPQLFNNKKRGFSIPLEDWLRGPLVNWADDLLAGNSIRRQGIFKSEIIADLWSKHRKGAGNYASTLWSVLMFQSWYNKHHDK